MKHIILDAVECDGIVHFAMRSFQSKGKLVRWLAACHLSIDAEVGRINKGDIDCIVCLGSYDYATLFESCR